MVHSPIRIATVALVPASAMLAKPFRHIMVAQVNVLSNIVSPCAGVLCLLFLSSDLHRILFGTLFSMLIAQILELFVSNHDVVYRQHEL